MKLSLLQAHPDSSLDAALEALDTAAREAAAQGADLLLTPEMFVGGYNIGARQIQAHAEQSGQVLDRLGKLAKEAGIAIVAGLALPGSPRPLNSCIAIDKTGREMARYHKTHLFGDVDRDQFTGGHALSPIFDLNGWKTALAICYDVEFPELTRALALRGAEVILCPTANMVPFDSVATRLVPARSEENAIYLAYCNYTGREGTFSYNGLSCVTGPDGSDLARAAHTDEMLLATLSHADLTAARRTQNHLTDRRADLYGDLK